MCAHVGVWVRMCQLWNNNEKVRLVLYATLKLGPEPSDSGTTELTMSSQFAQ